MLCLGQRAAPARRHATVVLSYPCSPCYKASKVRETKPSSWQCPCEFRPKNCTACDSWLGAGPWTRSHGHDDDSAQIAGTLYIHLPVGQSSCKFDDQRLNDVGADEESSLRAVFFSWVCFVFSICTSTHSHPQYRVPYLVQAELKRCTS